MQDGVRQSESTLPPGMVTSPLTVHFTFATNDKKQAFQICQMDASGDLIALETQTQNNSDDTVTLTAQTQSMGCLLYTSGSILTILCDVAGAVMAFLCMGSK